jgi:acyl CoA:acetate/3-ketoacid CoA transferase beta subunit
VFDFNDAGDLRVRSLHEGVTVEQVVSATGFDLDIPAEIPTTVPPTDEELTLLRQNIDPEGRLRDE